MLRYRINWLTLIASLSLVLTIVFLGAPLASIGRGPRAEAAPASATLDSATYTVKVLATQAWTDTGIDLTAGSPVAISATGTISVCCGSVWTPAGNPSYVT